MSHCWRVGLRALGVLFAVAVFLVGTSASARADMLVTFTGTGYQVGEVSYSISGSTLTITLTNTAMYGTDQLAPVGVLTGVIFTLPTGVTLDATAATITPGSLVQASMCDVGPCDATTTDVSGEFGYTGSLSGGPAGYNAGLGSSGQVVGDADLINPALNLDDPDSPDGINFGIVGANFLSAPNLNPKMTTEPLISDSVKFTLTITSGTLTEDQLTNWALVFGTAWGEGTIPGGPPVFDRTAPDPATLLLLGGGLVLAAARFRRKPPAAH
jgi:hypothetical protein